MTRIVLCAGKKSIENIWRKGLADKRNRLDSVRNEEDLLKYLSSHEKEIGLLFLEDIWVGEDVRELKELIVALNSWYSSLNIMVLSQYPNYNFGKELLNLGIKGYGNARMLPVHFQDAYDCVKKGDIWVYPEFVQMMIKNINSPQAPVNNDILNLLSPREKEIAQLVCQGHTNGQISEMLGITLRTVKAHTSSIYEKLKVKDRIALVLMLKNMSS